jgi:hypothetical protein
MEPKNLNFDEIVSQYTTTRYRAYFYIPGYDYIYTDWYYGKSGLDALQTLRNIVCKSEVVEGSAGYIQSQRVVVAKAVRIGGGIENEE